MDKINSTSYSRDTLREDLKRLGIGSLPRGKAIRAKCLDCCGDNSAEVARCHIVKCPLWPFRFGFNPYSERTANPASMAALAKAREEKKKNDE